MIMKRMQSIIFSWIRKDIKYGTGSWNSKWQVAQVHISPRSSRSKSWDMC